MGIVYAFKFGKDILNLLLLWLAVAFLTGYICKSISVPVIVGYIFAGFFLKSVSLNTGSEILSIPAEIGVELLLFSIGLKIRPRFLLNKSLFVVFLIHSIVILGIYLLLMDLNLPLEAKVSVCLALTLSSTIIASKALEGRNEATTFHGRLSLVFLIFQDLLALGMLIYSSNSTFSLSLFALLILVPAVPLTRWFINKIQDNNELELLAVILMIMLLGAALFKYAGLTGEIGALIIGVLFSSYARAEELSAKIWSLREILLLTFFLALGMNLEINLPILLSALSILAFLTVKAVILFGLLLAFRLRAYTAFLIAVSLSTYSEFAVIIITDLYDFGIVGQTEFSSIILGVCLSFVLGAILNKNAHELYEYFEKYLLIFESEKHHPDEQPHTCGGADVMVLGMGRIGFPIFESLRENNIKVVGFDADTERVKSHLRSGIRVTFADAEDPGFWSALRFGRLKTIILALPEFTAQTFCVQQARKYGFKGKIIVPTRSQGDPELLKSLGADEIYDAYQAAGIGVTKILLDAGSKQKTT